MNPISLPGPRRSAPRCLRTLSLLLGLALGSLVGLSAAEPAPAGAPLRVGVSPVFPPMVFKQGRDLAGAEVDLARALGEHLKRPVTFVELPWADQIPALRAGRIDIIMSSLSVTPSRAYVIDFSQPYMIVAQSPLVRREDQNAYTLGIAVDTDQTLGALKATTGEFLVQRDFPKARRKVFSSPEEAAQALRKKKIDLFIADSTLVWYLAGLHATDGLAAVPLSLNQEQVAWGIRKGNDDLLQRVNAFLDKTTKDGSLNRTLRRWMAVPP